MFSLYICVELEDPRLQPSEPCAPNFNFSEPREYVKLATYLLDSASSCVLGPQTLR